MIVRSTYLRDDFPCLVVSSANWCNLWLQGKVAKSFFCNDRNRKLYQIMHKNELSIWISVSYFIVGYGINM